MADWEEGVKIITRGGGIHEIKAQGWNAFDKE